MIGEKLTTDSKNEAIICPSDSVDLNNMTEEQRKRYEHSCNTLINAAREVISESKKEKNTSSMANDLTKQKSEQTSIPISVCLNEGVSLKDMSDEERLELNKGIQSMVERAQELFADDSKWKPEPPQS
ncbi:MULTISPECIES: hypothetical protein [Lactococcus]|uniref:hypothetical protein n=1 Tax=Lactococcus TaxID=1357 RepID=UPI00036A5D70|nr:MULTISPECIES: hypothetical protein [Lactococcus]